MRTWIDVKERLPELHNTEYGTTSKRVLVWVADGGDDHKGAAAFGWRWSNRSAAVHWILDGYGGTRRWNVTHWSEIDRPG